MEERKFIDAKAMRDSSRSGHPVSPRIALMLKRKAINARLLMQALRK